jgi:hypothetical protein
LNTPSSKGSASQRYSRRHQRAARSPDTRAHGDVFRNIPEDVPEPVRASVRPEVPSRLRQSLDPRACQNACESLLAPCRRHFARTCIQGSHTSGQFDQSWMFCTFYLDAFRRVSCARASTGGKARRITHLHYFMLQSTCATGVRPPADILEAISVKPQVK